MEAGLSEPPIYMSMSVIRYMCTWTTDGNRIIQHTCQKCCESTSRLDTTGCSIVIFYIVSEYRSHYTDIGYSKTIITFNFWDFDSVAIARVDGTAAVQSTSCRFSMDPSSFPACFPKYWTEICALCRCYTLLALFSLSFIYLLLFVYYPY